MANDNKKIGDIVKKCKILLLDIEGTTTSISFVKDKLFPYAEENVKQFLDSQWETDDVKEVVAALRKLALEDQEKSVDGVVVIPGEDASKEDQINGLVSNVKWQMSSDRKEGALKQLQGLIWKQGYDSGDIKGHVYDDVSAALEQWHSVEGQKVYIYSSGSVQAQKLLFGKSLAGDLLGFIDGHFDTAVGAKQEAASYTAIAEKIAVKPDEVLFLTDIPKEGEAARLAGFHVALVSREGNAPLSPEATEAFAVVHSLAQLTATNKRKTEPQDELPAKVPKTDTEGDIKTASESVVSEDKVPEKEVQVEQEKMEVDDSSPVLATAEKTKVDETIVTTETIIEDVTNSEEILDVPMVEIEPIVTEENGDSPEICNKVEETEATENVEVVTKQDKETIKSDEIVSTPDVAVTKPDEALTKSEEVPAKADEVVPKPEEVSTKAEEALELADAAVLPSNESNKALEAKPTENIDANINDNDTNTNECQKVEPVESKEQIETQVVKEKAKIAEETPPEITTITTEIEEITTENIDVADMIENLEPIVEEPPNDEEMEDLQNVGEVLEKECDEILSKVQDVTNLDSIPLKPLLNPIAEETMETEIDTENMDSNDIVDRILDTELELEMKQCNEIDLNTVSEITDDVKTDESTEIKLTSEKTLDQKTNSQIEVKVTENDEKESSPVLSMDTQSSQQDSKTEDAVNNTEKIVSNAKLVGIEKEEKKTTVENNVELESNDKVCKEQSNENIEKKDNVEDKEEKVDKIENDKESKDVPVVTDKVEENTSKMESNNKVEETQVQKVEEAKTQPSDNNKDDVNTQVESKDTEMISEEAPTDNEKDKESQVNGKATNGDTETVNVNGDSSNVEELNSRLSVENGKETVNGSNGDSVDSEKGQGDKVEAEVSDIKVKTVATEEPRTDPIEQPTEA